MNSCFSLKKRQRLEGQYNIISEKEAGKFIRINMVLIIINLLIPPFFFDLITASRPMRQMT